MIDKIKLELTSILDRAVEPDDITKITAAIKDLEALSEEISRKDSVITRQAGELKRFILNDCAPATKAVVDEAAPVSAPQPPQTKTLEDIVNEVLSRRKE